MTAAVQPLAESQADNGWAGIYPLPNSTRSPGLARMLLRQALMHCPPATVESAELLASELVTNAVRHAETELFLHIILEPRLRVVIEDTSADGICARTSLEGDDEGRGLTVVAALA